MKYLFYAIVCASTFLLSISVWSQSDVKEPNKESKLDKQAPEISSKKSKPQFLSLGYFGNGVTQPGAAIGYEIPILYKFYGEKKDNGRIRRINKSLSFFPRAGFFSHPKNQTAFLFSAQVGIKMQLKRGFFFDTYLGPGYMLSLLAGETYTLNDQNQLVNLGKTNQSFYTIHYSNSIGFDLWNYSEKPLGFYLKHSLFYQAPINVSYIMNWAIEFGVIYHFKTRR